MIVDRLRVENLVDEYRRGHRVWTKGFPPLIRGCFSSETFRDHLFDDAQTEPLELHHFAGGQHVHSIEDATDFVAPLVDTHLISQLKKIVSFYQLLEREWSASVADLPQRIGQPLLCWSSLFRSVVSPVAIRKILNDRPLEILEIGPGSGYTSLLLAVSGHRVSTIDVSLGYACWQSVLFDCFKRYTADVAPIAAVSPKVLSPSRLYSLSPQVDHPIDVVIANHMLNEMSRHSLVMMLESFRRLRLSPLIVCDGWGFGSRTNPEKNSQTERLLNWFGYELRYHVPHTPLSGARSVDWGGYPIPITIFEKVRDKDLGNCFGDELLNADVVGLRDLSLRDVRDEKYKSALLIEGSQDWCGVLQDLYEKHVLRDASGAPVLRTELTILDYIGLNSNTKRPYVRGENGLYF